VDEWVRLSKSRADETRRKRTKREKEAREESGSRHVIVFVLEQTCVHATWNERMMMQTTRMRRRRRSKLEK
jgi:hypothetical protein